MIEKKEQTTTEAPRHLQNTHDHMITCTYRSHALDGEARNVLLRNVYICGGCSISSLNKKTKVLFKISFEHKGLSSDLSLTRFLYQRIYSQYETKI